MNFNMKDSDYMLRPRSLHGFSRDDKDMKKELDTLRASTKQALEQAWGENSQKDDKIAALERQMQEMLKRESNYRQQVSDLSKQARRGSGQPTMRRPSSTHSVTSTSDLSKATKASNAGLLDKFLENPTNRGRSNGGNSITGWSVGTELRELIGGKNRGGKFTKQEVAAQLAKAEKQRRMEVNELCMQLHNKDAAITNLEQANHKHQLTIRSLQQQLEQANQKQQQAMISLQMELERVKYTARERESLLNRKVDLKREMIAQNVKELQNYQNYVGELTKQLEKVYSKGTANPKSSASSQRRPSLNSHASSQKSSRSRGLSVDRSNMRIAPPSA